MEQDSWTVIKEFYKDTFGFPEGLIELVAVQDILKMCVSGSSNASIAKFFNIDPYDVRVIIDEWLEFIGWPDDLEFNPYHIYKDMVNIGHYSFIKFRGKVKSVDNNTALQAYRICQQYYKYEDMIKNEWH